MALAWWFSLWLAGALLVLVVPAHAQQEAPREYRVDTFDTKGNRTGYVILNPTTGRVDQFDPRYNRRGSAAISPPPAKTVPGQLLITTPQPILKGGRK